MTLCDATERVVVVSPHLDDAILSLGAAMSRVARGGARVEVLTVFAGDTGSAAAAGSWDRRAGFRTESEAAMARRREDEQAGSVVGSAMRWLDFRDRDYRGEHEPDRVWSAVRDASLGADAVLLPGFPLTNTDHAWLTTLLVERGLPCPRLGVYAEQPYRYRQRAVSPAPTVSSTLARVGIGALAWIALRGSARDVLAKRRAILAYRSQAPLLGLATPRRSLLRLLLHERMHGGEAVAWLPR